MKNARSLWNVVLIVLALLLAAMTPAAAQDTEGMDSHQFVPIVASGQCAVEAAFAKPGQTDKKVEGLVSLLESVASP